MGLVLSETAIDFEDRQRGNDMCNPIARVWVDWRDFYGNLAPEFHVEMKEKPIHFWPEDTDPAWINLNGIHIAIGMYTVPYFYSDGKPTHGFAGRIFSGTFTNGDYFSYKGAWSSRAACINKVFPVCPIVDVIIGNRATAVYADDLIQWVTENRNKVDFGLAWVDDGDCAPILQPTRNGMLKSKTGQIVETVLL